MPFQLPTYPFIYQRRLFFDITYINLLAHPLHLLEHSQEVPPKDISQVILSPVPLQEFLDQGRIL